MKQYYIRFQIFLFLLISSVAAGQRPGQEYKPGFIRWIDDSRMLIRMYDEEKKPVVRSEENLVTVEYDCRTGKSVRVEKFRTEMQQLSDLLPEGVSPSPDMAVSSDRNSVVILKDNDLWYHTAGNREGKRLTRDSGKEMNARFAPGDKKLAYTKDKDLYYYDLESGRETRLTFDATDRIYNGWASWVYMEEILGRASRYAAFWWSPDAGQIAYLHTDDNPVPLYYLNALETTDGTHGKLEITPYPKPGDPNPKVRMGVVDLTSGNTTWVKTDENTDQYIAWPSWTPDSRKLMIQVLNRDQNDMRFILADVTSGDFTEVYRETRPTWIDFFEDLYVMQDGSGFIVRSYRNDWYNLYYYGWDGSLKSQITNFNWKVTELVRVDEAKKEVYFHATGSDLLGNHLFRVRLDGTRLQQITSGDGFHTATVSPGGSWFIDTWSSIADPGGITLIDRKGKTVRSLFREEAPVYDASKHPKTELVKIKTADGLFDMPALITYPLNFDPSGKYPVVFTIYGGPDAGSIRNRWQGVQPRWYAENGIVTINVDHRGSGTFGKKGLDYMHRSLGKWEISDYSDAVQWLRRQSWADDSRMGITGGSYGGYVTSMALTAGSEYWTHGIADYSVTDWRLYDNVYTERYMDTPEDNPEGYKNGSAITHAASLKGKLLVRHGDMDDNVHMQNSIWLITTLQDLNKPFEMMIYPGERHGWGGPKRIFMANETNSFWLRHFFGK
ncbi:MAG: S9 family peptidase [Bacteroidales bacterium]|jgi:dipeptidyl-peptidase-4|nr:S9 family peptidase [Bacteroidales bacterium]